MKTGDYLLIPGGKYTDMKEENTYYNDIYCGEGLGDHHTGDNEMVSVDRPGPVTLR